MITKVQLGILLIPVVVGALITFTTTASPLITLLLWAGVAAVSLVILVLLILYNITFEIGLNDTVVVDDKEYTFATVEGIEEYYEDMVTKTGYGANTVENYLSEGDNDGFSN